LEKNEKTDLKIQELSIMPKVHIRTFGCQMNKYDSNIMAERFLSAGYSLADKPEDADIILFNSCSVREHAKTRLFGVVNSMKPLKRKNPSLIIGICGCVAQEENENILCRLPHVDIVCGTRKFSDIVNIIEKSRSSGKPAVETGEEPAEEIIPEGRISENEVVSFVTILRGCSNFCSYCIVP
jgi:tRNA-2-methylthio-N6-dimethylallyladenosine synthase